MLRRPHVHYELLVEHGLGAEPELTKEERERTEIDIKYQVCA